MTNDPWQTALFAGLPLAVVMIGWWSVHRLNARRDRQNKIRELRTRYLVDACRTLTRVGLEKDCVPLAKDLEDAISDIYLFGTPSQVRLAKAYVLEMSQNNSGALTDLIMDLRNDLRRELDLPQLAAPPHLLKINLHNRLTLVFPAPWTSSAGAVIGSSSTARQP